VPSLISILYKCFPARSIFTSSCLATASNSGNASSSRSQALSNGNSILPLFLTDSRTNLKQLLHLSSLWLLCTVFNSTSIVACVSVAAGVYSPSRCLETNVVSEPFASNCCFYSSIVLALSKYATTVIKQLDPVHLLECLPTSLHNNNNNNNNSSMLTIIITILMFYGLFTTASNNNLTPAGCPMIWKTRTQFIRKADFMCCTPTSLQDPTGRTWRLPTSG
jgi:hypothetical protein